MICRRCMVASAFAVAAAVIAFDGWLANGAVAASAHAVAVSAFDG